MGEHPHLTKVQIEGRWWAHDAAGTWYRWDEIAADWAAVAAGAVPPLPPQPPARVRHWAADPLQRIIFVVAGAVITFLLGLVPMRAGVYDWGAYLVIYPLVAVPLIAGLLYIGGEGAERMRLGLNPNPLSDLRRSKAAGSRAGLERSPLAEERSRRAVRITSMVLAVPFLAVPLAAVLSGTVSPIVLVPVVGGAALAVGLANYPRQHDPNWILIPVAATGGVLGGLAAFVAAIFLSVVGGGEPGLGTLSIGAVLGTLYTYASLATIVGRFSGNSLTLSRSFFGAGVSIAASVIAIAALALVSETF